MRLLQKDVAGILGVDTTTVFNWENNRCSPRLCLIPRIVMFLGYSPLPTGPKHTIGVEIMAYRVEQGLSQKKLAEALGIDPTTLARWESRKSLPRDRLWVRLAQYLQRPEDEKSGVG